jgi:hypothetical protein
VNKTILWSLLAIGGLTLSLAACGPTAAPTVSAPSQAPPASQPPGGEIIIYPSEYVAYRKYLDVIGGTPGAADTGVIEATVISINKADVCPYDEEECRIDPYPNDWGIVRVDRIIDYTPYDGQSQGPTFEQPGSSESPPQGETTSEYTGKEPEPQHERGGEEPLQEGQEVQAHFLLSARPAKVKCVSMGGAGGIEQTEPVPGDAQRTSEHPIQPGEPDFGPLVEEDGHLVFVTKFGDCPESSERTLPGLQVGSSFHAQIQYDGILYISEYTLLR